MGLHQAFPDAEIVGVDIRPQPRYPFTFVQGDALEVDLTGFDFAWASPPCQGYSRLRHLPWLKGRVYPLLIEPIRRRLLRWGGPWIMENVEDAPLLNGVTLCGTTLGLPVYRHRKFEATFMLLAPAHRQHTVVIGHGRMVNDRRGTRIEGSAAGAWGRQEIVTVAGGQFKKADGERALGIDWMSKDELSQAIPPAYSRYLAQFIPLPVERAA
jgi:DNA (cytosine-5)-methyltransferase 1